MKKTFLSLAILMSILVLFANHSSAQLEDGSIAPDWTLTDIEGNTWNLYDLLDQNISVFLDYSAVWCGPCWSYHTGGNLEALYEDYGPDATGEVMVFMIEGDGTSTLDELNGIGGGTQGNWVSGTPYPIVLTHVGDDSYGAVADYDIAYFPTIYRICPTRIIKEVGQASETALYNSTSSCEFATVNNDPAIIAYTGVESACSNVELTIDMQNMGFDNLTSCTIKAYEDGVEVLSKDWTGNLSIFDIEEVNIGTFIPSDADSDIDITITSADEDATNNTISTQITYEDYVTQIIHLEFKTDNYPTQLRWEIRDESDDIVYNDGPYSNGEKNEVVFDEDLVFPALGCYTFTCYDTGGEGIQSPGYFEIRSSDDEFIADNDNDFGVKQTVAMRVAEEETAIDILNVIEAIAVYPNPANETANVSVQISNTTDITISVVDLLGNNVMNITNETVISGAHQYAINTSDLSSGIYFVKVTSGDTNQVVKFTVAH